MFFEINFRIYAIVNVFPSPIETEDERVCWPSGGLFCVHLDDEIRNKISIFPRKKILIPI